MLCFAVHRLWPADYRHMQHLLNLGFKTESACGTPFTNCRLGVDAQKDKPTPTA